MTATGLLKRALPVAVAAVVLLFVLGQLPGQPILLSYVATGSMEPTMDAGDGFVAVPSAVTGPPSEGDVVVFDARELHDGGLTTHRVVDETDEGDVTKGDANPFTD
jgi:signal peptidase I